MKTSQIRASIILELDYNRYVIAASHFVYGRMTVICKIHSGKSN